MTYTQEQLMEWLQGHTLYLPAPQHKCIHIEALKELFTGHKLVPADAVVLTREDAETLYSSGDRDKLEAAQERFLAAIQQTAIAQPQPKCKCEYVGFDLKSECCNSLVNYDGACMRCGHDKDCHASGGGQ